MAQATEIRPDVRRSCRETSDFRHSNRPGSSGMPELP